MHPKNPVSVLQIPNAVGLDAVIQKLTDTLTTVPWLEKVFGRAWTHAAGLGDKPKSLPFVYVGKSEYFEVVPNDYLASQVFLKTEGPERFEETEIKQRTAKVQSFRKMGLIVWVNLKQLGYDYSSDYPYTENLKNDLYAKLRLLSVVKSLDEYTDEPVEVFKGYDLSKVDLRYLQHPYAAFKITFTVKIFEPCQP